jgi:hypothetical protein
VSKAARRCATVKTEGKPENAQRGIGGLTEQTVSKAARRCATVRLKGNLKMLKEASVVLQNRMCRRRHADEQRSN